jgi:putative resolvase
MTPNMYSICELSAMKLTDWARHAGIHPKTARRWFHQGVLPVPSRQLSTGTILVETPPVADGAGAALYARVSSWDHKADLDRQLGRLSTWAARAGLPVVRTEAEVGSGLTGRRRRLMRLLADPTISAIVVEHRDRLGRFGVEYLEAALGAQGRRVVVADPGETTDDLGREMVDVLTAFCARVYGRRSARNRALRAVTATKAAPHDRRRRRRPPSDRRRR